MNKEKKNKIDTIDKNKLMTYTLLIGNNFILNSPKKIRFYDKLLFTLNEQTDNDVPIISAYINNNDNKMIIEVNDNKCGYCDPKLIKKKITKNIF
ncbi:MAG: hypothetical protein H0X03_00565 [Nitrosopumilus sp.]|nr:hypothetical protein [Nitrosopumilus sp.]